MMLRNGKYVTDVRVDLRYLPISKATKRDDGTVEPATESSKSIGLEEATMKRLTLSHFRLWCCSF